MLVASRMACLIERICAIWLPMWKCSRRQSSMSSALRRSVTSTISRAVSPNFERSLTESCQRPELFMVSFDRTPMTGGSRAGDWPRGPCRVR